jgi:hypothetical protein
MSDEHLSRSDLIALGRGLVTDRLRSAGWTVSDHGSGKLAATSPDGRAIELFVSTQRLGGYAVWTKRRFQPSADLYAAIAVLGDGEQPDLYLLHSTEWEHAAPPLTDRDNVGKRSEPEFGVLLSRSNLPALERYRWDDAALLTP